MEREAFVSLLSSRGVAAAAKDDAGLDRAIASDCPTVFMLYGSVLTVAANAARAKDAGKLVFVHLDFVDGLAPRDVSVEFIAAHTRADGIISTKPNLVRAAKALGLLTVQRFFVLDSKALDAIKKQLPLDAADVIEVLPGPMPKVIRRLAAMTGKPIVAGGLIFDAEDAEAARGAGAVAISTSNPELWR